MKFIHFSDAHIGVTTHGKQDSETGLNDRVLDFLDAFDFIIDAAEEHAVDFVIFAGDMFHNNRPSPQLVSEVSMRLKELAEICDIFMIPGNHDQAMNRVSALQYLEVLQVDGVYMSDEPTYYTKGDIFIACVPYPTFAAYGVNTKDDKELALAVANEVMELSDVGADYPTKILVFHGTVEGAQWGSYTGTALGSDAAMFKEVLADWDYVALGHIHLYQDLGGGDLPPIVYPGSIERVDFGEAVEDKGFIIGNIEPDKVTYEFVPIPARPMARILVNLREEPISKHEHIIRQTIKQARLHTDSLVRIIIQADDYSHVRQDFIYAELEKRAYRVVGITIDVPRVETRNLGVDNITELPPAELLEEYLISIDASDEDIDAILDIFDGLMEEIDG